MSNSTDLIPSDDERARGEPMPEIVIGYYECVQATIHIEAGWYVRVIRVERGPDGAIETVHLQRRNHSYTISAEDFPLHFEYAPEGEQQFQRDLLATMGEVSTLTREVQQLDASLTGITVHVDAGSTTPAGLDAITALVPVEDRSPKGFKLALARLRSLVHEKRELLEAKSHELQAMFAEQSAAALALIKPLQDKIEQIKEGIWTVDLYLGKDEEIVTLREGDPAPADTPITLRQLVLAMDQEAKIADDGGIDSLSIEKFDEWIVARPEHLQQVLPEPKGVVVLVPRWEPKKYADPWLMKDAADANAVSYFLIRNGSRLWRISTNFVVGRTLVPTEREFYEFFNERRYNTTTHEYETVPLQPGSRAYMDAQKKADARQRHYMRIALILQGLLDRTTVFRPLSAEGIQITRPEAFEQGYVNIIYDYDYALSDGRERFKDWLTRINSDLDVGQRILGNFGGYEHEYAHFAGMMRESTSWRHPRLKPSNLSSGDWPSSLQLYTLEEKRDDGFIFYFERGQVFDREAWMYRQAQRRASCLVKPSDRFILAFDQATEEEMRFFLQSRLDRDQYEVMVPLLKAALRLKAEERAAEAPFRQLLAGHIAMRLGVDQDAAEAYVTELVPWYKYKNRTHRPLVGDDDGKAYRLIMAEAEIRVRETEQRKQREMSGEFSRMLSKLLAEHPNALLIAHRSGSEYVVVLPANEDDVFVHELILTARRMVERRDWRTMDGRYLRWHILYSSERWPQWRRNASIFEHITDPEIHALAPAARQAAEGLAARRKGWYHNNGDAENVVMAVTFDRHGRYFHIYMMRNGAIIPAEGKRLTGTFKEPQMEMYRFDWKRTPTREVVIAADSEANGVFSPSWPKEGTPWASAQRRQLRGSGNRGELVLFEDTAALARFLADRAAYHQAKAAQDKLYSAAHQLRLHLERQWLAQAEQARYEEFLREYGDPSLWEGHRKSLKKLNYPYAGNDLLFNVTWFVVERGLEPAGMTFGQARQLYQAELVDDERSGERASAHGRDQTVPTDMDDLLLAPAPVVEGA